MTVPPPEPYQGRHLIADLHQCSGLDDAALVRAALVGGAAAAGAHLLGVHLHAFGLGQGVTGVALLAESHISIHSWPEHGYAAIDIFMCGRRNDPDAALGVIAAALGAARIVTHDLRRGYSAEAASAPALGSDAAC